MSSRDETELLRRMTAWGKAGKLSDGKNVIKAMRGNAKNALVQEYGCCALQRMGGPQASRLTGIGACEVILSALRSNQSADNVAAALSAVANLSNCNDKQQFVRLGAAADIADAMRAHPGDHRVISGSCVSIMNLVSYEDDAQTKFKEVGIVEIIFAALETHREHAGVLSNACTAMTNLSRNSAIFADFQSRGASSKVLLLMRAHKADPRLQSSALSILKVLMAHDQPGVQMLTLGAATVIFTMKQHPDAAEVQGIACGVISSFCCNQHTHEMAGTMSDKLFKLGAAKVVVAAMRGHVHNMNVQRYAFGALKGIGFHSDPYLEELAALDAPEDIVTALRNFAKADAELATAACDAMPNLASVHSMAMKLMAAGAAEEVRAAMLAHPLCPPVQAMACSAFRGFGNNNEFRERLRDIGIGRDILKSMRAHPNDAFVQDMGCAALSNLTFKSKGTEEQMAQLVTLGACGVVMRAMHTHLPHTSLQTSAMLTLVNFAATDAETAQTTRLSLLRMGAGNALLDTMEYHAGDSKIQKIGLQGIGNLVGRVEDFPGQLEIQQRLIDHNALGLTLQAMRNHRGAAEMQQFAIRALYGLVHENDKALAKFFALGATADIFIAQQTHPADDAVTNTASFVFSSFGVNADIITQYATPEMLAVLNKTAKSMNLGLAPGLS